MSLLSFNVCRRCYAHYIMYQNLEKATCHQDMSGMQNSGTKGIYCVYTAADITTVCPTSSPFRPACIFIEFVQKTANKSMNSL
jgi:hypothetical protein